MSSIKPFLDHPDLIANLQSSGVDTGDSRQAERILRKYGYHRLSGYRYLFREMLPTDEQDPEARRYRGKLHLKGTKLEDIAALADFDHRLRMCVVSGTEDFEVRLRTAIAHQIAQRDELGHLDVAHLDRDRCNRIPKNGTRTSHELFLRTISEVTDRALQDNDDFAIHHQQVYGSELPVWAVVEHLTFGALIFLYTYLETNDKRQVARKFGINHPRHFEKYIRAIGDLRNKASHGVRLFNKPLKYSLSIERNTASSQRLEKTRTFLNADATNELSKRMYAYGSVLHYMLSSHESGSAWGQNFATMIDTMPSIVLGSGESPTINPVRDMGFPADWKVDPLWITT